MRQDPSLRCTLVKSESHHSAFCLCISVACLFNGHVTCNLWKPIALLSLHHEVSIHEHLVDIWVAGLEGCHLKIVDWLVASIVGAASDKHPLTHGANSRQVQCPVTLSCGTQGKKIWRPELECWAFFLSLDEGLIPLAQVVEFRWCHNLFVTLWRELLF